MKNLYLPFLLLLSSLNVCAQDYKGIWTGHLRAEVYDATVLNMQYILHVKDQNQNIINGKAYLYRNNPLKAEGALDFIGVIKGSELNLKELKILYSRIPADTSRFLCIKDLELTLSQDKGVDNLNGTFTGAGENTLPCYPGKAYLQRFNKDNQDDIPPQLLTTLLLDDRDPNVFMQTKLARPIVIEVTNNVIELEIGDYLREDGDIISVFHNRKPFIKNLPIVNKKSIHTLRLNRDTELHELILYAENLGRIPPNTSTLKVFDGTKEHQIQISSSKEVSAVVYLRYNPAQKNPSQ
ncbi:hypothetical protein [Daejeonella lutea]|uniref:Lipocalin-like domain-containing protein n=1 Tax=Daejeonella lutea TaxID=572036 RepID=A0A1T4ZZE5_9SPHI|nr:hypothetical protein [Daejeonella lutea]SKB28171.1 hypothetical protein SAMN05661099_0139 [Daejeonella lutea]